MILLKKIGRVFSFYSLQRDGDGHSSVVAVHHQSRSFRRISHSSHCSLSREQEEKRTEEEASGLASTTTPTIDDAKRERRLLIETVEKITGPTSDLEWKRFRKYIYHCCRSDKKLSIKQTDKVMEFLSANFDDTLVRRIVQSTPKIFRKSVSTQLEPTLNFLRSLYSGQLLTHALHCKPELLLTRGIGYTATDNMELMQVYLSYELRMSKQQIQKLKNATGSFLFKLPMHKILLTDAYFRETIAAGINGRCKDPIKAEALIQNAIKTLILKNPHLLRLSVENNLKPRVEFLRDRCNLEPAEVAHLLQSPSAATIMGLSIQSNLAPTLNYLDAILNPDKHHSKPPNTAENLSLKGCILAQPQILGLSLQNLRAKVTFFNAIGNPDCLPDGDIHHATSASLSTRVLKRGPSVFSLSLASNIIPTVEFLARVWGVEGEVPRKELSDNVLPADSCDLQPVIPSTVTGRKESLAALIGEYPTILSLSLDDNIVPTVRFFNQTGYIVLQDDWRPVPGKTTMVLRARYIASSLHQRLLPRWHFIHERHGGENKRKLDRLTLHILAFSTDEAFCKHMKEDCEGYLQYKRQAIPRLKFSSDLQSWFRFGGSDPLRHEP